MSLHQISEKKINSRALLQSLSEDEKDELVKLVLKEITYTVELEKIDKVQVLNVKTVLELIDRTIKRIDYKSV